MKQGHRSPTECNTRYGRCHCHTNGALASIVRSTSTDKGRYDMAKTEAKSKQILCHLKKSTPGTYVYKQDEAEGRHTFYFDKPLFDGQSPADVLVTVSWK